MEKDIHLIPGPAGQEPRNLLAAERAAVNRVRRLLAELRLPCKCQGEIDKVMAKLDDWESRRLRQQLIKDARQSILQVIAGFDFLQDIADTPPGALDSDTCRDHAETLRFLGETASSAALMLDMIADINTEAENPGTAED